MPAKLPRSFYSRSALDVACDLLGKVLVRRLDGYRLAGKIVETEAYVGPHDLACHASKGHTPRTSIMFGRPGFVYVYMIYGFYFCLNAVTGPRGYPAAVLVRAVEPLESVELTRMGLMPLMTGRQSQNRFSHRSLEEGRGNSAPIDACCPTNVNHLIERPFVDTRRRFKERANVPASFFLEPLEP